MSRLFSRILRLSRLPGQTLALTAPVLLIAGVLAEIICRQPAVTTHLPTLGLGFAHGNFESKLIVHSAAYHRYLRVSGWMLPDFHSRLDKRRDTQAQFITRRGYEPEPGQLVLPLPDSEIARVSALFSDYHPVPAEWDRLHHIITLNDPPVTQVVLVEIPLNPLVVADYMGEDAYGHFNARIAGDAAAQGVLYWPTSPLNLIPDPAWANANHVNNGGARLFSRWFGAPGTGR